MEYVFHYFSLIYANKQKIKNHKPLTSKNKNKNFQHLKAKKFNI